MNPIEVLMNDRETGAFVDADSVMISLRRPLPPVSDGAGGFTAGGAPTIIPPQVFRVLPARSRSTRLGFFTPEAEVMQARNSIIYGPRTLDVQRLDEFDWRGETYQVQFVNFDDTLGKVAEIQVFGVDDRSTL